jgi:hypothetical protein
MIGAKDGRLLLVVPLNIRVIFCDIKVAVSTIRPWRDIEMSTMITSIQDEAAFFKDGGRAVLFACITANVFKLNIIENQQAL